MYKKKRTSTTKECIISSVEFKYDHAPEGENVLCNTKTLAVKGISVFLFEWGREKVVMLCSPVCFWDISWFSFIFCLYVKLTLSDLRIKKGMSENYKALANLFSAVWCLPGINHVFMMLNIILEKKCSEITVTESVELQ